MFGTESINPTGNFLIREDIPGRDIIEHVLVSTVVGRLRRRHLDEGRFHAAPP